ncbi:MAG: hypothetical protein M1828_002679 [Chrysothrix sp. TS-e1954]|nr:MAG: hypothetical protein M1828_002679 [Chrysothrix sp. TS-e1954]
MTLPLLISASILIATPVAASNTLSLKPNATAADAVGSASQIIDPAFCGMGIEPSNLFSFTGGSSPNTLSVNLLNNLANYTGFAPHFRIGGNTEDNMIYDPDYKEYSLNQVAHPTGQGNIPSDLFTFGPTFFEAIDRFPTNTPITYGLNLAYDNSDFISHIVAQADAARTMLKNVQLVSFEIGNEPDLYLQNSFRNGSWDGSTYTKQWLQRAEAVYEQVLKPNNISSTFFEPGCTASTIGTTFQIEDLVQAGITAVANDTGSNNNQTYVATWNQHDYYYYIGVSGYDLTLDMLMQLPTTYSQFLAWVTQTQQAFAAGFPYALREMASVGPIGQEGISDVFGATLWQLNFFLYAASLNISTVQMHMTDDSYAAPWQPTQMYGTGPHVRTTYYAWAAVTQLIGGTCSMQVAPISVDSYPGSYSDRIGAYATYQYGDLASVVVINTKPVNASDSHKNSLTISLSLPAQSGQTLYLSYLTADGADSKTGTVWNGISYEQSDDGKPTTVDKSVDSVKIDSSGTATFTVRDSQAVVAALGAQIGTGANAKYNATACGTLASSEAVPGELPIGRHSSSSGSGTSTGSDGSSSSSSPTDGSSSDAGSPNANSKKSAAILGSSPLTSICLCLLAIVSGLFMSLA